MPAANLAELVALARAKPGTFNYGSYGSGSQPHLAAEMLKAKAGIDIVHIPYKGIPFAVPAAIAGEVQLTFSGIASSRAQVQAGRLKALAIGGPKRSPALPNVPTVIESGVPGYEVTIWWGFLGPAGLPPALTRGLNEVTAKILTEPEAVERLAAEVAEPAFATPAEFGQIIQKDIGKWIKVASGKKYYTKRRRKSRKRARNFIRGKPLK